MDPCDSCQVTEYQLVKKCFENNEEAIRIFERHSVLPYEVYCPFCKIKCSYRADQNIYRCLNILYKSNRLKRRKCSFSVSKYNGTFLEKTRLAPWKILLFICAFLKKKFCHSDVAENLNIDLRTSVDYRSFCAEVCEKFIEHQEPIGGPDIIVEIDETVIVKRKYNRGRNLQEIWLFGGIERVSKKLFLVPLIDQKRDSNSLIPLVKKYILPGTIIVSDSWRAYSKLKEYNCTHWVINHSKNFVDPVNPEIRTQSIERA